MQKELVDTARSGLHLLGQDALAQAQRVISRLSERIATGVTARRSSTSEDGGVLLGLS